MQWKCWGREVWKKCHFLDLIKRIEWLAASLLFVWFNLIAMAQKNLKEICYFQSAKLLSPRFCVAFFHFICLFLIKIFSEQIVILNSNLLIRSRFFCKFFSVDFKSRFVFLHFLPALIKANFTLRKEKSELLNWEKFSEL